MDGLFNWIMNSPHNTMITKVVVCEYDGDSISGNLAAGTYLLIGYRRNNYAHLTAYSYWGSRPMSVATIENGAWAKRFEKVITNTDLQVKRHTVPQPTPGSIFTEFKNWWVRIFKSGKAVTITLNISGSMTANNNTHSLFAIPEEYRPTTDVIINYVTQKGSPMLIDISGDLTQLKLGNMGKAITEDWLCRQCITYVTN